MKKVLDATAIRSGMTISGEEWYTTPGVVREVRLGRQAKTLDMLLDVTIRVMSPDGKAVEAVTAAARDTNDLPALSDTDMEVLALAYQLGAVLLSDDYAVQNVAAVLGLEVSGCLEGIREVITWTFRCRGCGRYFKTNMEQCPVCGSPVRRVKG